MPQFVPTETECRSGCKSSVMGQAGNVLLTPGYGTFSCRRWPGCSRCGKRLLGDAFFTLFGIPDLLRAVVKIRPRHQDVAQVRCLEGGNVGLFLGDQKPA